MARFVRWRGGNLQKKNNLQPEIIYIQKYYLGVQLIKNDTVPASGLVE